jgi:hypothetical protein
VAVVVLMGQISGFVEFARHGLKAAHNVVIAEEQASQKVSVLTGATPPCLEDPTRG